MARKKKFTLSTTQIILLSFLVTILIGSVLLALPISSATGEAVSVIYETSVEAMAKARLSTDYKDLVLAIMRYGDSVAAYYAQNS